MLYPQSFIDCKWLISCLAFINCISIFNTIITLFWLLIPLLQFFFNPKMKSNSFNWLRCDLYYIRIFPSWTSFDLYINASDSVLICATMDKFFSRQEVTLLQVVDQPETADCPIHFSLQYRKTKQNKSDVLFTSRDH